MKSSESDTLLIDLHYLPGIEYIVNIRQFDCIILEVNEYFVKQTFRNRCYILGANGILPLYVPVLGGRRKVIMKDLQIDHDQKWLNNHWRAIQSAYGKAPFYEFYIDYFEKAFHTREKYLVDLNFKLLTLCLDLLGLKKKVVFTEKYEKCPDSSWSDFRSLIHPKTAFANRTFYQPSPYPQLFGKDFVPALSILDLLLCEGPNSNTIVSNSTLAL
ncbi:WbqC family protein [Fulvivirga sp. M361]|uniref:WbqC family protein n=1 Tax=Fulvivirga sp. M361 TaxID=2594266 RepID=UPI001179EF5A|nr:WbqC family protein [Fulvivirga sp. M361]TRX53047.1 WbqC family protein [Fulvivirga sp. M361]